MIKKEKKNGNLSFIIMRQTTYWEKTFANHISDNGLVFRIYKELSELSLRQRPIRQKTGLDISSKKIYESSNKLMRGDTQHN